MPNRKTYETQFLLGAKVQSSLGKAFGTTQQNMKAVQQQAKRSELAARQFGNALKWVSGIAAGYFSLNAILDYGKQSSEAAKESISNETKLATVMKQRMKATDAQINSIIQLAAVQQRLGVVEDDTQIAGGQQLATYLKQAKSLQVLMPAMNDLLAQQKGVNATSTDAVNIANMMGKVFTGQVGALRRVGISFNAAEERVLKYGNEQQKAVMLAKVITNNVGRMNLALAQTDEGKLAQARNMLGDMQEEIGKKLIPMQVKMAETQLKFIPYIEKALPLLDKIPPLIEKGANAVDFVIKNWDKIGPVVEAVTVAILANKAATLGLVAAQKAGMVINMLSKGWNTAAAALALLREGNSLAAVAQAVLNGTMLACPITWIVAGITALVVGGYYLIKNWDKVKAFFIGLWNGPLNNKYIQAALVAFLPFIGLPIAIIKNWGVISTFFGGLWEGIVNGFKTNVNVLISLINLFISGLNLLKVTIPDWVPKVGGKQFGFNIPQIPMLAKGTTNFQGGLAITGERGRELVNLPRGSQVTPHNRTEQLLRGLSGGNSVSISYAPQFIIQGNADERVLKEANDQAQADFERKLDAYFNRRRRLNFA